MGRKKQSDLIDTTPSRLLRRSDAMQYWLDQMDYPKPGQESFKKLRVIDKLCIGMIDKAMEGNAPAANFVFENAWGKNTEGADSSSGGSDVSASFNIPQTVSELKEIKEKEDNGG